MSSRRFAVRCLGIFVSLCILLLAGCGGSAPPPGVSVTASSTTVDGTDSVTLTATVTNDHNAAGVTWSVSGGGSLSNTTTTSATYTAPAATGSSQSITVTATSVADSAETGTATLTVPAKPTVSTTSSSLTGSVGTAFSVTLQGSGGIPPYRNWAVSNTGSALPSCLTLNASTGVLSTSSGTAPTSACAGTYSNLVFTYQDSGTPTPLTATSSPLTVTIAAAPAITFTNTVPALPGATFNTAYSTSVAATGGAGALTYSIAGGALPADLSLNSATGAITGTPKAADIGSFSFTVKAADGYGDSATQAYTLAVTYPALTITTASPLPTGYGNTAYSRTLAATGGNGGPYTWSVTAGGSTLTAVGLSLSSAGVVSGATPVAGAASFTVKAADSAGNSATANFTLTINPALAITTAATLPTGYGNVAYSQTLAATGGSGSGYTWSVTAGGSTLTAVGLSLSSAGVVSGATPVAGAAAFTAQVTDSAGNTASQAFTLTIDPALTITTAASLPSGYAGTSYSQTLAATGGSGSGYTWSLTAGASSLSALGLTLSSGGALTGSNPTGGSATFTAKVTDSVGNTASQTFTVTIESDLSITTAATLPTGYGNTAYSQTLAATGGSGSGYTWSVTAGGSQLSAVGLSVSSQGVVAGTAPIAGSATFTVQVTDSQSHTASQQFSVTINPALTITTGSALPQGFAGTAYSQSLAATGGSGSGYTWSVTAGASSLAAVGLSVSGGGAVTGASPIAGTASFTAKVTDSAGNTASQSFSVIINAGLAITTGNPLPSGQLNESYGPVTLAAGGGSGTGYTWSITANAPPPGITLNSSTGTLSGLPTSTGAYSFTVQVTDSAHNTASSTFTINIYPDLSFTPTTLPTAYTGTQYTQSLTGQGGSGSGYTYSIVSGASSLTSLGLNLLSSGAFTGTPTATGTANFTVQVKDGAGDTASASLSLTVAAGVSIVTPSPLLPGYAGASYSQTLTATGGTGSGYTWSVAAGASSLSALGLTLSSGGAVTGGSPVAGTASFTAKVTDSAGNSATASFSVTIEATLAVTTASSLPGGTVGVQYSQTLAATGGSGSYTWSVTAGASSLSSIGLTLTTQGVLSGSSPTQGSATFTAQVTDSQSHTATQSFTVTIYAGLTITTTSLPAANVGAIYSQTLSASGGTGQNQTWTATSGNLASFGLSLSGSGVISGTPTQSGTASFTAKVTDSGNNSATQALTITVYAALSLPASNLPAGYVGVAYSASIVGSGGSNSSNLTISVVSGLPADGISAASAGASLSLSGTPASNPPTPPYTVTFTLRLTDSATGNSITQQYTISVTQPAPPSLPAPGSSTPGPATVNQSYSAAIAATGGVGPNFTWTVNGSNANSGSVSLGNGSLMASTTGNNVLNLSGTPGSTGQVSFTVKVTDTATGLSSTPQTYTITVNPNGAQINGQITLQNNCGTGGAQPTFSVTINTSPSQTTQTDSNGNFSFSGIPAGTYTLTPSLYNAPGGAEAVFSPANYTGLAVSNGSLIGGQNFSAEVAYTVSGQISYGGSQTGQVYIYLNNNYCGSNGGPGTSITPATLSSGGNYTIVGVPPGSYTAQAWMDSTGVTSGPGYPGPQGAANANDPTGTSNFTVSAGGGGATGINIVLSNPSYATPPNNPSFQVIPSANGVLLFYSPPAVSGSNGNQVEAANEYVVQWAVANGSDTINGQSVPTCTLSGGQFATIAGSHTFYADGTGGATVWIMNNTVLGANTFTSGTAYCFQARAFNTLAGTTHPSGWYEPTDSDGNPQGFIIQSTNSFCSSNCTTVSGTVTIPAGVNIAAGAPLYVGVYQQSPGGKGPSAIYATEIASPTSSNNYSLTIPNGSGYVLFGTLDQNNDGQIDVGDVTNVRNNNSAGFTASGSSMTENLTLPGANSTATVQTQYSSCGASCSQYSLNLQVNEANKLPVAVYLVSAPSNVLNPVAIGLCTDCGNTGEFEYNVQLLGGTPNVGDTYSFNVTYSDGSTDTVNGQVTAFGNTGQVVGAADAVTNMNPGTSSPDSTTLTPNFTWTFPANPGDYVYSFYLQQNNCNNCTVWQIPGQNSNANGFTYAETGSGTAGTIDWGVDPTGDSSNTPNPSSLQSGIQYYWIINVQDSNGNQAQSYEQFTAQ